MSRYSRHIILSEIGQEGQHKISNAKVLVVGAGGLGCPILQYLTAAGIGTIGIIDFDVVETSNLQRQILFGTSSIGQSKALAAKTRLEDLNPTINIIAYPEALAQDNALALFKNYDIIVDGTDNFNTRYLINDAALLSKKPIVYGAIYKFEGQVAVFNYKNSANYRCLFPNPPKEGSVANCSEVGVLGVLPGIIGTLQANEVLKIILNLGDILNGKLLSYNAKTNQTYTISIPKSGYTITEEAFYANKTPKLECSTTIQHIDFKNAIQLNHVQFIDVREPHETPKLDLDNCVSIPLKQLIENRDKIDKNANKVFVCQSGVRSQKAIKLLEKLDYKNCYNLEGGMQSIIKKETAYESR